MSWFAIDIKENLTPLLGLNTTEKMKLLTIHKENFVNVVENVSGSLIDKNPDVFDKGLGTIPGKVHLCMFMNRCQLKGIKLNSQKLEFKCDEVPLHGHLQTAEGPKPDPEKVRAIVEMPRPEK